VAEPGPDEVPVATLFDAVVGQPSAVAQLRAAAHRPVHAYLLHGPPGTGKRAASRGFAAALLCPDGGCGHCNTCRRTLAGTHPDLVLLERTGASVSVDDAREIAARAQRRPLEADRQVLVVTDIHLATGAAPALLKTVEEPPPSTVFVLIGDELPVSLATIASRCVKVAFDPVPVDAVTAWLVGQGVTEDVARSVAEVSGGRLDRARLLATDPAFTGRVALWHSVPGRLDGTGAAAAVLASELLASAEGALEPLRRRHQDELASLVEQAEAVGARGVAGRKDIEDRHKREERRWRTDELRIGLATLAAAYRDRLVASTEPLPGASPPGGTGDSRWLAGAVDSVEQAARVLGRNPNEALLLEALLVGLSGLGE
jgi:DNA polymerase-3 subunit delta'